MVAVTQPLILPLKVFSVAPLTLDAASSANFTITGDYFSDQTTVEMRIGSGANVVTNTVWSANNQLTVTTGPIAAGSYSVTVINGGARVVASQTVTVNAVTVPFFDLSVNGPNTLSIGNATTRLTDITRSDEATTTQVAGGVRNSGTNWPAWQFNDQQFTTLVGTDVKDIEFIKQVNTADFVMMGWGRENISLTNITGYHWGYALIYHAGALVDRCWGGGPGGNANQSSAITPTVNLINGNWYRFTVTRNGDSGDGGRLKIHQLADGTPASWAGGTQVLDAAIPTTQQRPTGRLYPMVSSSNNSGDIRAFRVMNSA